MKVCIICSLSNKEACDIAVNLFESLGIKVHHPFLDQNGSLYKIQRQYLKAIDDSDIIVAIPKSSCMNNLDYEPKTKIVNSFGESVSYEIAYARHTGKPVIIWGEGGSNGNGLLG